MKVIDFIICDDIRIEQLSKISLMGIYNDRIAITVADKSSVKWPFVMSLGLYVRLDSSPGKLPKELDFNVDFIMNDKTLGAITGSIGSFSESFAAIPIKIPQFPLTGEGALKFNLTIKKKSGEDLYSFTKEIQITIVVQNAKDVSKTSPLIN